MFHIIFAIILFVTMLRINKIAIALFTLLLISVNSHRRIYYLHNEDKFELTESIDAIVSNSYDIPVLIINCNQKNCERYKVPATYPQLVFWNGPGCSYKCMETPTIDAVHKHFEKVNSNPIKPLRDFLERISLLEAFGVAFGFGTFLYIVFTKLFSDKSTASSAQQKEKIK